MKHALLTTPIALGLGALMGATAITPASAQSMDREYQFQNEPMSMDAWKAEDLAGAWQASELIDEADVYGQDGEELGEVEDVIVGADDKVRSIIIEAGGFWDIGDTHFAIPFDQVKIARYDDVRVPLTEENVDDYDIYTGIDEEDEPAGRAWRVSELINDYASLRGGERYGYVDDVLIGEDGSIKAVVVDGTSGYGYAGPYAMPYYGYGYGWGPGYRSYNTGYTEADLENLPVVSEDSMSPFWDS